MDKSEVAGVGPPCPNSVMSNMGLALPCDTELLMQAHRSTPGRWREKLQTAQVTGPPPSPVSPIERWGVPRNPWTVLPDRSRHSRLSFPRSGVCIPAAQLAPPRPLHPAALPRNVRNEAQRGGCPPSAPHTPQVAGPPQRSSQGPSHLLPGEGWAAKCTQPKLPTQPVWTL